MVANALAQGHRSPDHSADRGGASDRSRAAKARCRLTQRERNVAVAVGAGLSNAGIAARLYLGVPTVKAHIGRLFTKLEVTNRVHIAICVQDAGLG